MALWFSRRSRVWPTVLAAACLSGAPALTALGALAAEPAARAELPLVVVDRPGMVITSSARVRIAPELILPGTGEGVLRIDADGVVVEFEEGSVLRGAPADMAPDTIQGLGLVISGRKDVTIRNFRASGYKVALYAVATDGLKIEGATITDLWRQRLASTPQAEASGDWLWPHRNDAEEWRTVYGGAVVVRSSRGVWLSQIVVRRSQNGILLDRVDDSRVFDNDCSFLSGWGLAMWRSSGNTVSRNAFDFCIRGYSHGVYNRGQDSAGILMFEQCSRNIVLENSATHSGDGVFGFAGREALGEDVKDPAALTDEQLKAHKRAGSNDNLFMSNDLSHAAAHGLEMTFSWGNRIVANRIVDNAISGCWLGYCAQTLVYGNLLESNGLAAREGGGVLIEHGRDNRILSNTFADNRIGVSLWARHPAALEATPWGRANAEPVEGATALRVPSTRTTVAGNRFDRDAIALRLRSTTATAYSGNTLSEKTEELDAEPGASVDLTDRGPVPEIRIDLTPLGRSSPVGARSFLAGRKNIVMGEWGPWDHQSIMVRLASVSGGRAAYEVFGVRGPVEATVQSGDVTARVEPGPAPGEPEGPARVRVVIGASRPGVVPWSVRVTGTGLDQTLSGLMVNASWAARVWGFEADPMTALDAWRAEAEKAAPITLDRLDLPWGYAGPRGRPEPALRATGVEGKRFGLTAETTIPLTPGSWRFRTLSDDGVRVIVDGRTVIERWDVHVPTADAATVRVDEAREVPVRVEYFQMDGYATMRLDIEPIE
jgi:nitrous oxidase accessory protein NosD